MNTTVSFEIAKLLKEKGFDRPCCEFYYMENNPNKLQESFNKNKKWDFNFENEYHSPCKSISAPTIAEVVMWLYEKHGIWIQPTICSDKTFKVGCIEVNNYPLVEHIVRNKNEQLYFNSPTEAYEAAIEYTLNNLI